MAREKELKSRSRITHRSSVPSRKSRIPLSCESPNEKDFVLIMEFSTNVVEIRAQPQTFKFEDNGCTYRYTPDFEVTITCGTRVLVEIKGTRFIDQTKEREKLAIVRNFFEKNGREFHILVGSGVGDDQTLLSNIRHLKRYRTRTQNRMEYISAHIPDRPMTIKQLQAKIACTLDEDQAQIVCTELIANQLVWCDLRKEIRLTSIVQPMGSDGYVFIDRF